MSIIYADKFDHWNGLPGTLDTHSATNNITYNNTYKAVRTSQSNNGGDFISLNHLDYNEVIIKLNFAIDWTGVNLISYHNIIGVYDSGTAQATLRINSDRTISLLRGTSTVLVTSTGIVTHSGDPDLIWHDLEWKIKINPTGGTSTVMVDNFLFINQSGMNTRSTTSDNINGLFFGNILAGGTTFPIYYTSLIYMNTSGSTMNDILGPVIIETIRVNSSGYYNDWTPNVGTTHDCVDDLVSDSGNTYVEGVGSGATCSFGIAAPSGIGTIHAVCLHSNGERQTGGTCAVNHLLRYNLVDSTGAGNIHYTAPSYAYYTDYYENSPFSVGGTGAWTCSEFTNLQIGMKII